MEYDITFESANSEHCAKRTRGAMRLISDAPSRTCPGAG